MIKVKPKKCKGTGQAKGFGCGKETLHRVYGLGKSCCYANWLYTSDAGKVKMQKAMLKVSEPKRGLEKMRADKNNKGKLEALKNRLKTVLHEYIRLRDKYKTCISCNAFWNVDFQAGHFFKAELYSNLKFNDKNINGQCRKCNLRLDGNFDGYKKGFIERFGAGAFKKLDDKATEYKQQDFKFDREDLKEDLKIYNELLKTLKSN